MQNNKGKIGVVAATALSVTIIVGAGLLVLPGLSFMHAGRYGYIPWILVAIGMIPLLIIFSYFGKNHPSAGGVVGYVRVSLGNRWATVCETIVLGTFTLGVPAIALVGAQYLHSALPSLPIAWAGAAVVTLAFALGLIGLRVSGAIQTIIATIIVVGLISIGIGYLWTINEALSLNKLTEFHGSFSGVAAAVPIILFAFTGWEMTAFLAEDMKNPAKDLPRSIWYSYAIVTVMYIFLAWLVASYGEDNRSWYETPITQLAKGWLGVQAAQLISITAALLIIANVVAAFVSVSRAIYSAGRDGMLPTFFANTDARKEPIVAMVLTFIIFQTIIFLNNENLITLDLLLQLAGQNFFVLYLLAAVSYIFLNLKSKLHLIIGLCAAVIVVFIMTLFSSIGLIYCAVLSIIGYLLSLKKVKS